ncbi:glycosyl hydrolase family 18 protein [Succinispira mobilis]|uniref:glycosyl hydrolase family 18 protein n=1 Tax=Succinispira mobilis TaxID=78120 RepID=UPI00035FBADC|nr:glycosyl hydrolase family 18 protein [Succinispira mobilis]
MYIRKNKIARLSILVALVFMLTGCNYGENMVITADTKVSTWIAYWDLESGRSELKKVNNKINKLSHFAAYFDVQGKLFVPENLQEQSKAIVKSNKKLENYLTIVNDREKADGSISLKDTEILKNIFADERKMDAHIDEIVNMTKKLGYQGIELDYEQIWKDADLGDNFTRFVNRLFVQALKNNLKLRVVLEPSTKFTHLGFSSGPEYVVMLYNLYGIHSEPGPKADKNFINNTLKKMQKLPGEKTIAFATGGCIWSNDGKKRFITEIQAVKLAKKHSAEVLRNSASQALNFEYLDENGVGQTVWYADSETLKYWMSVAKKLGYTNFSIWRLGGNVDIKKIF